MVKKKKYFLTELGKQYYEEQLNNGKSYKELAQEIDINPDTLSILCHNNNIAKDNRRKYTLNENYFSIIDTEEKAYWVGFLAADGYINEVKGTINLTLQPRDEEHIQKFLLAIDSNKQVKKGKSNHRQYDNCYVTINSVIMVKDLVKLGVFQNKSLTLKYPTEEQIPKELQLYWILGYFDGDGSISSYSSRGYNRFRTSFTGTYEVLSGINNYFGFTNKIRQEHRCLNNTGNLAYTEGKSKFWLGQAYNEISIKFCLKRKYLKYQEILNARNKNKFCFVKTKLRETP